MVWLSAQRTGHLYPQGWVEHSTAGRLCQWKHTMAPSRNEPATFGLGAHCLNQLRHRVFEFKTSFLRKQRTGKVLDLLLWHSRSFRYQTHRPLPLGTGWISPGSRSLNLLKPNDIYICRTAALTSRRYILNIYSTNIHTEYFKHAA